MDGKDASESRTVSLTDSFFPRWATQRDVPWIALNERLCLKNPMDESDVRSEMKKPKVSYYILESNGEPVGHIGYLRERDRYVVTTLCVTPEKRNMGIGRGLLETLFGRLRLGMREKVLINVEEDNLGAQLFLRSVGMICLKVTESGEYCFSYRFHPENF